MTFSQNSKLFEDFQFPTVHLAQAAVEDYIHTFSVELDTNEPKKLVTNHDSDVVVFNNLRVLFLYSKNFYKSQRSKLSVIKNFFCISSHVYALE